MGVVVANVGVVRIQLQSPLELLLCSYEVPVIMQLRQSQGPMPFGQALIFLHSPCRCFLDLPPALPRRYRAHERHEKVGTGHMSISGCIVGIELDDLVVILNTLLQIKIIEIIICLQVKFVCLGAHSRGLGRWSWPWPAQPALDLLCDIGGYLILQHEHIAEIAVIAIGPEMPVVSGAYQLSSYTHTIAEALH